MQKTTMRRKIFTVDERQYEVSITGVAHEATNSVMLRITIRANFGHRSFCNIRGLKSHEYFWNYGYWNSPDYLTSQDIEVTPRIVAELIRFAHRQGWSPESSKSNFEVHTNNAEIQSLTAEGGQVVEAEAVDDARRDSYQH